MPRLLLADRIADLPGVTAKEGDSDKGPFAVHVLLTADPDAKLASAAEQSFAEISRDGIVVHGLRSWDQYQVLSRGWGKRQLRHVLLFLPRDDRELETCWSIIRRAYESLLDKPAVRSRRPAPSRTVRDQYARHGPAG